MKKVLFFILVFGFSINLFSQGFTNINAFITGTHWGDVAWGDYDADGDLDFIVTGVNDDGNGVTTIYKNNGAGVFTELLDLNIPGTFVGDVIWGDYDADGDLDILIQGTTDGSQICNLYKNSGNDIFANSGISFPPLVDGSLAFVDYNNDGFSDILIAGYDGTGYLAKIYTNNGDVSYSELSISLPGTIKSSYEWADYDNDGDMDVFITGLNNDGLLISKLFNNDYGVFNQTSDLFDGAWLGDAAWGDYDNDGDLDLLLSGFVVSGDRIAKVYKNNGSNGFEELPPSGLMGVSHSSTIWGDYDNDGDLDIFIGGTYEGDGSWIRVTDVFINNGDDSFTAAGFDFTVDVFWGESAWGDYDNDGDLDLLCAGFDDAGGSNTIIYRNEMPTLNTPPNPPESLISEIIDNNVTLYWDAADDNETPSEGLSYNAYLKNENNEIVWGPSSIMNDGFRLIPALGNVQQNTSWTINDLPIGDYSWSVQSVDQVFAGSVFSSEETFTITYVGMEENSKNLSLLTYPTPAQTQITFLFPENTKETRLKITDAYGKTIAIIPIYNQKELIWNFNGLVSGIYFYSAEIRGLLYKGKFIVE